MSEEDKQEAKEHAERAGTQAKHAVKNTGRAAAAAAAAAADGAEDFYDAAKDRAPDVIEGAKDTAETAADLGGTAVKKTGRKASRVNPWGIAAITGDTGQGFMALTVAIWAGTISFNKFSSAYHNRGRAVR